MTRNPKAADPNAAALEWARRLWALSPDELEQMMGAVLDSRTGCPEHTSRGAREAAFVAATRILAQYVKPARIRDVVRRPVPSLGGRSVREAAHEGRWDVIEDAVRAMFELRRRQP